tara:strand:- start:3914 stop:5806 length:1893 start_codon:yes stop_codon:yes gene_type:complete
MENITVTATRDDPNVANSIDFLTGMPIGFFDNQQGLPSSLTQGEGYQTGISDDIQRQINEGLALQQAQHEEKMAEELAEELAENLESEVPDSVESALVDASQNMSLIDRIVQGAMARFGPTAGIRALNELFSILPGTGRITGGIEGLLDLGDEWVGDLASRNPFGRAIDRLAPAERAGRGAIESVENRYSKIVDPIKMSMEWMKIMQNPLAEVAGMAFEGKPNAQRLVMSALTPPPPGMAQGGPVMNYNDPLMMRRGGMTRRRRRRRGGVDSLPARRRRISPADARRQQRREEVIEREVGPMVPAGGAVGSLDDPMRSKPGMIAAQYRRDQRARERQRQRQAPLEQRRLPDNRAAIEQRMVEEQTVRDSYQPLYYGPTERARDAAISRYKKSLNMQEDLAGGPLAASPLPTPPDQIRFGPGGQPMPQREPLQGPGGGGSRLGTGYEPQRGQPGYRPPSPQSQVRDQRARYMPERRGRTPSTPARPRREGTVSLIDDFQRRRQQQDALLSGQQQAEDLLSGPVPGQQPPMPDSVQQMLAEMGAQQERLEQAKQQYQEQPQLPDSVLQMLEEMGNQQDRLDSFKQPDPLQQLMADLEMRRRRAQYRDSMPRRAAGGGMINADPFAGYRARRR